MDAECRQLLTETKLAAYRLAHHRLLLELARVLPGKTYLWITKDDSPLSELSRLMTSTAQQASQSNSGRIVPCFMGERLGAAFITIDHVSASRSLRWR